LNHPNIITIYYVGHHQTFPFLAMELLSGPTLADRLVTSPLEFGEAIRMSIQVVEALQHAEHFGIVHADIKPSNLMLHGAQQVKLSDFGLARMASLPMETEKISGTLTHMAPELTVGDKPTIQSDMYALGVTLFELLFGRLPYKLEGGSIRQWLQKIQEAPIEFPSSWPTEIPDAMRGILTRLMAKQPSARYSGYDELLDDLQAIVPVKMTTAGFAPRADLFRALRHRNRRPSSAR
jgi:serine/threonine protein kinase